MRWEDVKFGRGLMTSASERRVIQCCLACVMCKCSSASVRMCECVCARARVRVCVSVSCTYICSGPIELVYPSVKMMMNGDTGVPLIVSASFSKIEDEADAEADAIILLLLREIFQNAREQALRRNHLLVWSTDPLVVWFCVWESYVNWSRTVEATQWKMTTNFE